MKQTKVEIPDNKKWIGEDDLKLLKKTIDSRFGEISIYSNPSNKQKVFMKEKKYNDKNSLHLDVEIAEARLKIQHPNLVRMMGYSISTEKGLCSTTYYLRIFYLYFETNLRSEFAKRVNKKKVFTIQELRIISENIQQALLETHVNGKIHGDVRPQMIGLIKDEKRTRIVQAVLFDRLFDQNQPSQLQKQRMLNKKALFISPQLYSYINTKKKDKPMYGRQKNDFFGLGLSLLHVGVNNGPMLQKMYKPKGEFDNNMLLQYSNDFSRLYGLDKTLCDSEFEYLGLKMQELNVVETKYKETIEETQVVPSNGQPPYKQIKIKKAKFTKSPEDQDWNQASSWKTIKTTFQNIEKNNDEDTGFFNHQNVVVNASPVPVEKGKNNIKKNKLNSKKIMYKQ